MEKEIFKSKYITASCDYGTKIYTSTHLPATENMSDNEWEVLMRSLKNKIEAHKPEFIIDDKRNRLYSYSPDIQKWTLNLFINSWNSIGIKKYAQIKPNGIIEKPTTRQIEELAVNDFNMLYAYKIVEDYKSAIKWIKE